VQRENAVERGQRHRIVKISVAHPLDAEGEFRSELAAPFRRPRESEEIPLYSYRRTLQNSW